MEKVDGRAKPIAESVNLLRPRPTGNFDLSQIRLSLEVELVSGRHATSRALLRHQMGAATAGLASARAAFCGRLLK